jgi:hypothetical protein
MIADSARYSLSVFSEGAFQFFQYRFKGKDGKSEYHGPPKPELFGNKKGNRSPGQS